MLAYILDNSFDRVGQACDLRMLRISWLTNDLVEYGNLGSDSSILGPA